ncbi:MAG: hypothetical protein MJY48_04275 [Bacteroidales bacterium]|nr:hypothetical protein [Bacteroidales bacterium]
MKNIIRISAIAFAAALILGITGCQKVALDTAQYSDDAVTLASYGPNPVMRGGQLRFFGSNLQQIVEVNVPGVEPITAIEVVQAGKVSEIRVTLPVEGPEVGIVSIKAKDGAVYKTKKELTYTEPIVFESFEVAEPAYPGDVITLKGDYMYLVKHVVFEGGTSVDVQEGATRHEAKVVIPADAVSGKIIISDGAEVENLLYSEKDLTIGKPSVTKLANMSVKPGDEITFTGTHLEMLRAIKFIKLNETFDLDVFNVVDGKITVAVPDIAMDGVIEAVSYAGDSFPIVEIECIMPSDVTATNVPKAGTQLIFEGEDLDVVSRVDLAGAEYSTFELQDGKLMVDVSATVTDGSAKLFHSNGNFVEAAYTIVHPTITGVSPLELYAGDEPVLVEGTDLDLVTGAKIGTKDVEISAKTETSVTLATNVTSVGGKVTLTLANGEQIVSEQEVKMNYHSKVILTSRPAGQHIGQEVVLQGQSLDLVESIFIGDTKVTKYGLRTPEEIRFLMPWCKVGSYELKFQLFDGDIEIQADPIEVLLEQDIKTIWEGEFTIGAWDGGMQALAWGGYDWATVSAGTELIVYYQINPAGDYHQIRAGNGSWSALPTWKTLPGSDGDGNVPVEADGYLSIKLADADLNELVNNGGLVLCGAFFTVTKVQLVSEISQEVTLWEGEAIADNWGNQPYLLSDAGLELAAAGAKVGQVVKFYVTPLADAWKVEIVEGHWGPTYLSYCSVGNDTEKGKFTEYDLAAHGGCIDLTLTQDILTAALTQQWWGGTFLANGDKVKITKITLL